ncbi:MAG TPA: caspase family protein [Polyangiaceae bacterium]|nr:caspase family protein [Polyangiaceae bacterium]
MKALRTAFLAAAAALTCARAGGAAEPPPRPLRRIAVVAGANDPPPGRQPLRYAHDDARLMADTLERVGRFGKQDVHVLLEPRPADLLAALERAGREAQAAGGESLLVFYYSGHSDGQQVYPHGEALALADLRDRVAKAGARVRVAILDTCRGGGWTQTKGLTVGPPLDAADLMNVAAEGTALLASSSGLESAHEASSVKGSFFTHHVAAGLLGAADKSGDGNVTLQEVFEYAQQRTVRDSARMAATAQHPSFDLQLRGRQDVALSQLAASPSALEVAQTNALEIIHLGSGVTVAETPAGQRRLRLALVPGRYLVRRVAEGRVYSKEVEVRPGAPATLDEGQLELSGDERLALKGELARERPYSARSTPAARRWELRLALGTSTGRSSFGANPYATRGEPGLERSPAAVASLAYGLTDRLSLQVPVPALAYRFGQAGSFEAIPRFGLTSLGYVLGGGGNPLLGTLDAGVAARAWVAPDLSLIATASADWDWQITTAKADLPDDGYRRGERLNLRAGLGLSWDVNEHVTLALGVGLSGSLAVVDEAVPLTLSGTNDFVRGTRETAVLFGSVQALGYRPLPLVQVHLSRKFSLDGYASVGVDFEGRLRDRYLAGFTWGF